MTIVRLPAQIRPATAHPEAPWTAATIRAIRVRDQPDTVMLGERLRETILGSREVYASIATPLALGLGDEFALRCAEYDLPDTGWRVLILQERNEHAQNQYLVHARIPGRILRDALDVTPAERDPAQASFM